MINATLTIIRGKEKENITASISRHADGSFKSWNFTGKLNEVEGYTTKDGVSLDKELVEVDAPTTVIIYNEKQGQAIYERAGEIFEERLLNDNPNPAINLVVNAKTLRVKETNILIVNVKQAFIDADVQVLDTSDNVLANLQKLKAASKQKDSQRKQQVSSARAGLGNLARKVIKTYL